MRRDLFELELINRIKELTIFCSNCRYEETVKFYEDKITLKCGCGVTIYYFPKQKSSLVVKRFVSKQEYLKNKELKKNGKN